jgi:hypothetical protein
MAEKKEDKGKKISKKEQNKILRNTLAFLAIILIMAVLVFVFLNSVRYYEYEGVKFETIKEGNLIFYKTTIPVEFNDRSADYNFYLRTKPSELKEVPFNGNLTIKKIIVFNPNKELDCDGDGIIAVANIVQNLYFYLNASVIRDENASCDESGRYSLINIKKSDVTEINQVGNSCYEISIADCEILKGTERYMLEAFIKINRALNKSS